MDWASITNVLATISTAQERVIERVLMGLSNPNLPRQRIIDLAADYLGTNGVGNRARVIENFLLACSTEHKNPPPTATPPSPQPPSDGWDGEIIRKFGMVVFMNGCSIPSPLVSLLFIGEYDGAAQYIKAKFEQLRQKSIESVILSIEETKKK